MDQGKFNKTNTLCIGIDIAWFGGSNGDRDSKNDCIAYVLLDSSTSIPKLGIRRVALEKRDPDATCTLAAIDEILTFYPAANVILAIDAPIQAIERRLPPRTPIPQKGCLQRRACERVLQRKMPEMEGSAKEIRSWRPKIQPGAPLAPRIKYLLKGLENNDRRFHIWQPNLGLLDRIVIECFPAEAIWATKNLDAYRSGLSASDVTKYKKMKRSDYISKHEIINLVRAPLDDLGHHCGSPKIWSGLVDQVVHWILQDEKNIKITEGENIYKGGKILDDVVDTMICLATSVSYGNGSAHVWRDVHQPDDGHIIGPGGPWVPMR